MKKIIFINSVFRLLGITALIIGLFITIWILPRIYEGKTKDNSIISGIIKDKNNNVLPNVKIFCSKSETVVFSDSLGKYKFSFKEQYLSNTERIKLTYSKEGFITETHRFIPNKLDADIILKNIKK